MRYLILAAVVISGAVIVLDSIRQRRSLQRNASAHWSPCRTKAMSIEAVFRPW